MAIALTSFLGVLLFGSLAAWFRSLAGADASPAAAAGPLSLVLAAGLMGLLVFDVQDAIGILLLDSDLELLRRAPLRTREILALKLVDAVARTSGLLVVFLLPALLAFAVVYRLPPWGWAALPLVVAGLWAIALGLGVAITLALVGRMPARRVREALAQVSTLFLLLIWFANAFLMPRLMHSEVPAPQLIARLTPDPRPAAWLPSSWAARVLVAAAQDRPGEAAAALGTLLLVAALALGLAGSSAARGLEEAQARAATPAATRAARRPAPATVAAGTGATAAARARPGARPGALGARLIRRDWTVLGDLLVSAALWTVFPLLGLTQSGAGAPQVARAMLVTLAVALGYEVAARSLPFEREAGAWRQLAPVSAARWAVAKLAGSGALAVPMLALAAVALQLAFAPPGAEWLRTAALAAPALLTALAVGLWSGATFGDPRWTDPRAMLGAAGRLIALLLLALQVGLWIAIGFLACSLAGGGAPGLDLYGPPVLGVLLAVIPFGLAVRQLGRMEWPG